MFENIICCFEYNIYLEKLKVSTEKLEKYKANENNRKHEIFDNIICFFENNIYLEKRKSFS